MVRERDVKRERFLRKEKSGKSASVRRLGHRLVHRPDRDMTSPALRTMLRQILAYPLGLSLLALFNTPHHHPPLLPLPTSGTRRCNGQPSLLCYTSPSSQHRGRLPNQRALNWSWRGFSAAILAPPGWAKLALRCTPERWQNRNRQS